MRRKRHWRADRLGRRGYRWHRRRPRRLEVYRALGVEKNVSYHSAVADTAHCSYKTEYTELLTASIAAFLTHTGAAPGQIKAASGSGGMVNRADWIDWTGPPLP